MTANGISLQMGHLCKWDKHVRFLQSKINMMENVILHQFSKLTKENLLGLLETCAFDLYSIEFCKGVGNKEWKQIERSYHWLIKRAL